MYFKYPFCCHPERSEGSDHLLVSVLRRSRRISLFQRGPSLSLRTTTFGCRIILRRFAPQDDKEGGRVGSEALAWIVFVFLVAFLGSVEAGVYLTQEKALELAFGKEGAIERKTLFLTEEQASAIEQSAKSKLSVRVVTYYVGIKGEKPMGYAFFMTDTVRTMPAAIMVVVNPDATVRFVEILAFYEPEDYKPHPRWLKLWGNKKLEEDLGIRRSIPNISGATLTARTVQDAVRKSLAIFKIGVLGEKP